jgi:hypothetical protein
MYSGTFWFRHVHSTLCTSYLCGRYSVTVYRTRLAYISVTVYSILSQALIQFYNGLMTVCGTVTLCTHLISTTKLTFCCKTSQIVSLLNDKEKRIDVFHAATEDHKLYRFTHTTHTHIHTFLQIAQTLNFILLTIIPQKLVFLLFSYT